MTKIKYKLLLLLLFLVFTQGLWERLLGGTPIVGYAIDASILLFVGYKFSFSKSVPGSFIFSLLLCFAFIVGMVNGSSFIDGFLYLRYVIFFYLIYNQLYRVEIPSRIWFSLGKFILALVILQGIGSAFNVLVLGQRVEGHVGLMSSLGGTTATIFPLLILSITFIYFFFKKSFSKSEKLMILLIIMSAFFVGYSSVKRAIYFVLPAFFIFSYFLSFRFLASSRSFHKKFFLVLFFMVGVFPLLIFGLQSSKGVNYGLSGGENSWQVITNAFDYAQSYESSQDHEYGHTTGRTNTTKQIARATLTDIRLLVSGLGYGAVKNEEAMYKLGIIYGIVGFTRDIVSGGWVLMALISLLYIRVITKGVKHEQKMPAALKTILLMNFIFAHFLYSSDYTISLKVSFILLFLAALLNSPRHQEMVGTLLKEKKFL